MKGPKNTKKFEGNRHIYHRLEKTQCHINKDIAAFKESKVKKSY